MDSNDEQRQLPVLLHQNLNHPTVAAKAAYCDVHDLLALLNTATDEVLVYRAIHGQLAFTVKYPDQFEDAKPCLVSWKPNGSLIGVVWDDGSCCLYSGEDGKLVTRLPTAAEDESQTVETEDATHGQVPSCLAWTLHRDDSEETQMSDDNLIGRHESTVEDMFRDIEGKSGRKLGPDESKQSRNGIKGLAHSIATLDVTTVFPGLSALPSHGVRAAPEATKFTTQPGVDVAFQHSSKSASTSVDTLLVVNPSGDTTVFLDDSVTVGQIPLIADNPFHASHPNCTSQAVLSYSASSTTLTYLSLPLPSLRSSLLAVTARNTKNFQNLLAYVTHTVRCIQHDFTIGQQLPARLINALHSELQEKNDDDTATTALYELLMTARFSPVMTEWLTDIIKDTQRKRWDQAVSDMYEHMQTHLFMHLTPALDRLSIAASSLRGLAKMHEGTSTFDVHPQLFTDVINGADALRLVAEKVLLIVIDELRQFRAFIKWLKAMVDVASAGPGSKSAIETEGREMSGINVDLVERYIRMTMGKSGVKIFVERMDGNTNDLSRQRTVETLKAMSAGRQGQEAKELSTNLPALAAKLATQVEVCLEKITVWQQTMLSNDRSTEPSDRVTLPLDEGAEVLDMKMFPRSSFSKLENGSTVESTTLVLVHQAHTQNRESLTRFSVIRSYNGKTETLSSIVDLDPGTRILHAQLSSIDTILALVQTADETEHLISCTMDEHASSRHPGRRSMLHSFESNSGFKPSRFLLGGRIGKKVVVVLSEDGNGWMVLDFQAGGAGAVRRPPHVEGDTDMQ